MEEINSVNKIAGKPAVKVFCDESCMHYPVCRYINVAENIKNQFNSEDYKFVDLDSLRCKFRV